LLAKFPAIGPCALLKPNSNIATSSPAIFRILIELVQTKVAKEIMLFIPGVINVIYDKFPFRNKIFSFSKNSEPLSKPNNSISFVSKFNRKSK
jgi:hypothetical protein